jgi:hypothetical protein
MFTGEQVATGAKCGSVSHHPISPSTKWTGGMGGEVYSHSIVAGGFDEMS